MKELGVISYDNNLFWIYTIKSKKSFSNLEELISFLGNLNKNLYIFINDKIIFPIKNLLNIIKKLNLKVAYLSNKNIRCFSYKKVRFKMVSRYLYKYNNCDGNKILLMLDKLNSVLPGKWYYKNSLQEILFNEWKLSIDYKNNMENKINKEEFNYFKNWLCGSYLLINENMKGKIINNVNSYDYNSYFLDILRNNYMPYGEPIYNCNLEQCNHKFSLLKISITCEIKDSFYPFINSYISSNINSRWSKDLENDIIFVTNNMLELIFKYYNVYEIEIIENICFESKIYNWEFWNKYLNFKINSTEEWFIKVIKYELNKINGKTASKSEIEIKNKNNESFKITTDIKYLPYYIALIDYAKINIVNLVQLNKENFIYCVVDGIYLNIDKIKGTDKIDPTKIGYIKREIINKYGYFHGLNNYLCWDENGNINKISASGYNKSDILKLNYKEVIEKFRSK